MMITRRALAAPLLALLVLAGCAAPTADPGPAPAVTPAPTHATATPAPPARRLVGTLNPAVTQATIRTTICVAGWTATVRPPSSYTTRLKREQLPPGARLRDFEEDHLMPLALGGAPRDPANLRPVPIRTARAHDAWEDRLHDAVCAVPPRLTLRAAQVRMSEIKRRLR